MNRTKKALIALLVLGALAAVGAGTYATFNASTTNNSNTFATGSIVLQSKVPYNSATTCLSTGAGTTTDTNTGVDCGTIFNSTLNKPGNSASGTINVADVGSLAGTLSLTASTCTGGTTGTYTGTGDTCGSIVFYIQELDSSGNPLAACVYPYSATVACSFTGAPTLSSLNAAGNLLAGGSGVSLTGSGGNKNYQFAVQLPSLAGNNNQGRTAAVNFTWTLQ